MARTRGCLAIAAIAIEMGAAADASADEPSRPIRDAIVLDAGATCLEAETLADHIQTWLGSDVVAADVSIEVEGSPKEPRVVRFQVLRGTGIMATRRFDPGPASCENLHAAVGLAVAMALGASLADTLPGAAGKPTARGGGGAGESGFTPAWAFDASAMAATDVLPQLAFGIDAGFAWSFTSALALRFGLMALVATPGTLGGLNGHYDAELFAARIDGCAGADASPRVRIQVCTGFAGGALVAHGHSFTVSQSASAPWMGVANEIEVITSLGQRWSLDLSLGIILPLLRTSFIVRSPSAATVGSQVLSPLGDVLGLGAIYRF